MDKSKKGRKKDRKKERKIVLREINSEIEKLTGENKRVPDLYVKDPLKMIRGCLLYRLVFSFCPLVSITTCLLFRILIIQTTN